MVFKSARAESNQAKLEALIQQFDVYPFDDIAAREFGRVLTDLRRVGRPIPVIDVQIAAIAIAKDLVLLTADNHFGNVPQVRCENWL
jgi:tRNA(fMet)-specific endonuclease VapC